MQDFKTTLYQMIGDRIKSKRKELDISQVDLSEDLNLSRSSLSNIEVGRHQTPLFVLYKICDLLRIEINELIPSSQEIKHEMSLIDSDFKDLLKKENLSNNEIKSVQDLLNEL